MLFYVPRWAWKEMEGGTLERVLAGKMCVASYMCQNSKRNNRYMLAYFLTELAALVNLVGELRQHPSHPY
jgi:hypothetical protein